MFDYQGWVTDDGAKEFFFGYLFEIGEAEFGEEFLALLVSIVGKTCNGERTL